jgi:glutamyl/glutaminyl-tRNA synthetase
VFRLERVGSNPAIFNLEKLSWMNGQHMKMLPEEERVRRAVAFLEARGHDLSARSSEWRAGLVRAIGDRLKTLADGERYGLFALKDALEIEPEPWAGLLQKPEVGPRLAELARRIAAVPAFDLTPLEQVTRGLAQELGIKAGDLMGAARVALTGRTVAPGLFEVMMLLGRERAVARLSSAAERWVGESPLARV